MSLALTRAMVGAEILKLRRNRSLLAFALLLSVGVSVVLFVYGQIQHASNPAKHAPAGGTDGFQHAVRALGLFFGGLVSILIGAEAGTADETSGVFGDLVATGRSRLALFAVITRADPDRGDRLADDRNGAAGEYELAGERSGRATERGAGRLHPGGHRTRRPDPSRDGDRRPARMDARPSGGRGLADTRGGRVGRSHAAQVGSGRP